MTADLLVAKMKGMKPFVNTSLIVDSTEYLVRSGYCLCCRMRDRSFYFAGKRLRERVGDWYSFQNRKRANVTM